MNSQRWEVSRAVNTSAGMFGLWQPEHFAEVTTLDDWEDEVGEDSALVSHIEAGAFVPINIGGDGAFQITVRSNAGGLSERETRYRLVSSEPYFLISQGVVELGGLEAVGAYSGVAGVRIPLAVGRYSVRVHLIDWQAEPNSVTADGKPSRTALPDFIVEVGEEVESAGAYRQKVETFERS